jgi:hypothetical protein
MSLSSRIAIGVALVLALTIIVLGVVMARVTRATLTAEIDDRLNSSVERIDDRPGPWEIAAAAATATTTRSRSRTLPFMSPAVTSAFMSLVRVGRCWSRNRPGMTTPRTRRRSCRRFPALLPPQ